MSWSAASCEDEEATTLTRLVNFLPKMGSEDLDERDLEGGDLSVHEDSREIEL